VTWLWASVVPGIALVLVAIGWRLYGDWPQRWIDRLIVLLIGIPLSFLLAYGFVATLTILVIAVAGGAR
jgi:hypothetical protein